MKLTIAILLACLSVSGATNAPAVARKVLLSPLAMAEIAAAVSTPGPQVGFRMPAALPSVTLSPTNSPKQPVPIALWWYGIPELIPTTNFVTNTDFVTTNVITNDCGQAGYTLVAFTNGTIYSFTNWQTSNCFLNITNLAKSGSYWFMVFGSNQCGVSGFSNPCFFVGSTFGQVQCLYVGNLQ